MITKTYYPEDDPNLISPNVLEGHEGQLLKLIDTIQGWATCGDIEQWEKMGVPGTPTGWSGSKDLYRGSIVMYVACGYDPEDDNQCGWIDVLLGEKKYRIFMSLRQWMRYFIPWPHGAFISSTIKD